MELYFLRHAIAAEPGTIAVSHDSERPLTEEGIKKMEESAKGMRRMGLSWNHVLSSPYLRASDTAKIVVKAVDFKDKITFSDALIPSADFKGFFKLLKQFKPDEKILFVGHMPSIGEFVSMLIFGQTLQMMDYKKGGLCRVDMPEVIATGVLGQLKWFLTPKQLRSFR